MFGHRRRLQSAETLFLIVILLCLFPIIAVSKPCSTALQNQLDHDACRSHRDGLSTGIQGVFADHVNAGLASQHLVVGENFNVVCPDSNVFCFRSTLPGFLFSEEDAQLTSGSGDDYLNDFPVLPNPESGNISWPSNCGILKFRRCRSVFPSDHDNSLKLTCHDTEEEKQDDVFSCRKRLLDHGILGFASKEATIRTLEISDDSPNFVEISPLVLDWGNQYLYMPSMATLTVANRHTKNVLSLDEPYSTNAQFYPYNFSEVLLAPGEVATISFVFLPLSLRASSAQVVMQTNYGGFLIQCTGFALESPYDLPPLIGLDVSSSGKLRKNLSLFNPYDEALYVEEVIALISVSFGNSLQLKQEVCNIKDQGEFSFPNLNEWIEVKSEEVGLPVMSVRPHRSWVLGPQANEAVLEFDLSFSSKGKVSGLFCMELHKSSGEKIDTVMVPLEAELHHNLATDELASLVTVSLQALVLHDSGIHDVVIVSLRNNAPYVLRVVKISEIGESMKHFHIKYIEGLILFPGSETQVALVKKLRHSPPEYPDINEFCELVIVTNDTGSCQVRIPCKKVLNMCSRGKLNSSVGYVEGSELLNYGNTRTKSSGNKVEQPQYQHKVLNSEEGDEVVLKSWISHATSTGLSVLDDNEVIFPVVQVGGYWSHLITVKNPSIKPIVVQLVLNSGEIVDKCNAEPQHFRPPFSSFIINNKSMSPSRYGFSMAEGATTEAFIHPYGRASMGPIFFRPSNRCEWSSSLLIRNNLSGVEWLAVRGVGGLISLVLLEESETVHTLDFKSTSSNHNYSASGFLYQIQDDTHACSQPLSKELYAKNMGDLALEVKRIEVSGTECGMDGFMVEDCRGFTLQPGESVKMKIVYQSDFSAATVHRDLELTLATGIIVIPMKASIPVYMLASCKKSILWMWLRKSILVFVVVASAFFLVFSYFLPYLADLGYNEDLFKSEKKSVTRRTRKSPALCNKSNNSRFASPVKTNGLVSNTEEHETMKSKSLGRFAAQETSVLRHCSSTQEAKYAADYDEVNKRLIYGEKESAESNSPGANSVVIENCDVQKMKEPENLTVKTGKDKGRRRRKKRCSGNALSGLSEVCSSQSGNSTPSSPISPLPSLTPKRQPSVSPTVDQSVQARNPFTFVTNQQRERSMYTEPICKSNFSQPDATLKSCGKNWMWDTSTKQKSSTLQKVDGRPVLLPSATFPVGGRSDTRLSYSSSLSASVSPIAPLARAPGSKLQVQKTVKNEDKVEIEKAFTYDIWGEHIFAPSLTGRSKNVSVLQPYLADSKSNSFFVRGPQALMAKGDSESVSCSDEVG